MSDPTDDAPRGRPPGPPPVNMTRELIGSALGALAGAVIAQALGGEKETIVAAAIAGGFVGPGLLTTVRRGWRARRGRRDGPPPPD
ncbi:MAG TPA: hypothetical protein VK066_28360 [Chloroflexota bacterium]|nr:hypothetical protein [Chloroflexota bacterium]